MEEMDMKVCQMTKKQNQKKKIRQKESHKSYCKT